MNAAQSTDEAGEEAPLGGAGAAPRAAVGDPDRLDLGAGEVSQRPGQRQRQRPRGRGHVARGPRHREGANEAEGVDHVARRRRPTAETERRTRKGVRAGSGSVSATEEPLEKVFHWL